MKLGDIEFPISPKVKLPFSLVHEANLTTFQPKSWLFDFLIMLQANFSAK